MESPSVAPSPATRASRAPRGAGRAGGIVLVAALAACGAPADSDPDPIRAREDRARQTMVDRQLHGIRDPRVLAAMERVPRHRFVPEDQRAAAYGDHPLPIGWGQTISQPFVVAFMTEALKLSGDERVLEIGTGSGYQAAVLAECAGEVWSIEIVEPLAERAARVLGELGYDVHLRVGDGYAGWPEAAPFDAIMVTAAPGHVPQPLVDQLADGGRMILPVGGRDQELILIEKSGGEVRRRSVLPVRFVPMTGEAQERDG